MIMALSMPTSVLLHRSSRSHLGDTCNPTGFISFLDLGYLAMSNRLVQPYQRIVNDLRAQILDGRLPPHAQLPSHKELREQYGVAIATVQRALSELRNAGWIYSHQGRGSFVHESPGGSVDASDQTAAIQQLQHQITELSARLERLEAGQRPTLQRGAA